VETPPAPARPLLAGALALAAGGWAGSELPVVGAGIWLAAAFVGLATGLCLSAAAAGSAGRSGRAAAACVVIAALGGWRAQVEAALPASTVGRCAPERELDGTLRARLAPGRLAIEVPAGIVAADELVELRGGKPVAARARGPAAPPAPRSDAQRFQALPDELVRLAPPRRDAAQTTAGALERLRATLRERLGAVADPDGRALAAALVLGDLGWLAPDVPDLFVRTGTFHALAVSGVQVVLVAALLVAPLAAAVGFLARPLGARRAQLAREIARAACIAVYVPLTGAGPPVARAALSCAFARAAPLVRARRAAEVVVRGATYRAVLARRADGLSLWSLALVLECALHPRAAAQLSVQLSYAATLGLVIGTAPLRRILRPPRPAAVDALGRPRSAYGRALRSRVGASGIGALAASIAAVLATLPFVWVRLGEWSPVGVLATLAIAPPTIVLLVAGWIAAIAPGLVPDAVLAVPAQMLLATLHAFDALPGTPEPLPPRPVALLAATVILAFAALTLRSDVARRRCARLAAGAGAILLVPWTTAPRELEVHALDVGAGSCAVVRAPGLGTWVFDAGSRDRTEVARAALGPLLRSFDAGTIGVVVSHADSDHDGAIPWLVARHRVAVCAGALPAQAAERLAHSVPLLDVGRGRAALPALQGSCQGRIWLERGLDAPGNEGSRSLRVVWGPDEVVLTGDAEAEGLRAWLDLRASGRPLRLLLAPHHGSEVERLGLLLDATRPAEVWVSGPARPPIADELDRRGILWRSTGRDGPLRIALAAGPGWNGVCHTPGSDPGSDPP